MGSGWGGLFNQFFGIVDGGLYVFNGHLVLSAYLVEGHLACQSSEDAGHRHTCARITGLPCWISGSMMIRSFMGGLVIFEESGDSCVSVRFPSVCRLLYLTRAICASQDLSPARFLCVRWLRERFLAPLGMTTCEKMAS